MDSSGTHTPQLRHQTPSLQQHNNKRYSRMESEPDTPVPSSLNPILDVSAEKVAQQQQHLQLLQRSSPDPIDTDLLVNAANQTKESLSQILLDGPFSPPPPTYPRYAATLDEIRTATALQSLSSSPTDPSKLNHLRDLTSSLHKVMSDQSFAMGDLRIQLDEIQAVLDRVGPRQDDLTVEECQILQNAQRMKNLAEEVIASNTTSESRNSINKQDTVAQDALPNALPLTLSMPMLGGRLIEPTETPPPTATTPPPGIAFQQGYLRHHSSSASFTSSVSSDRQYTQDCEERSSRPSSAASSYRRHQKKKSFRQLEPVIDSNNNNKGTRYQQESNAAFKRISSLLAELITDASTAVSTAPDGSQQPSNIPLPQFTPLIPSDSELSGDGASDQDEADDTISIDEDTENVVEHKEIDDPFLRRLQRPDNVPTTDEGEPEVELEPADRYRTGFRSRLEPSKRLSSLFMELQNTQTVQDAVPKDEIGRRRQSSEVSPQDRELVKDRLARRPRHSSMSVSSLRSSRPNSICLPIGKSTERDEAEDSDDSASESSLVRRRPRQRHSISSLRPESVRRSTTDGMVQHVSAELDQTVETIGGLTRDLVAVAAHQNWMQTRLQKTLQFQKEQIQQIERAHSTQDAASLAGDSSTLVTGEDTVQVDSHPEHPLLDLSMSLKQVAVNVGRVLASSAKQSRSHSVARHQERTDTTNKSSTSTGTSAQSRNRFPRKEFSRYFQELEKIAVIGGRIGFGKGDEEGTASETFLEESQDECGKRRGSGSSTARSTNSSCRDSAAALADEGLAPILHVDSDAELAKMGTPVSQSRRGSTSAAPPDLEDFAAQCRLLTRALVLPFVQLTHHAMTSQDSALALNPRSNKLADPTRDVTSTLEVVKDIESTQEHSPKAASSRGSRSVGTHRSSFSFASAGLDSPSQKESPQPSPMPNWTASYSVVGRDLDSILKVHGDLSPDAIVRAKAFISTGLYLLHLVYWTVLFVIGTIILDPWLAETAGQQVVRIVDQVREAIAEDRHSGGHHQQSVRIEGSRQSVDLNNDQLSLDQRPSFSVTEQEMAKSEPGPVLEQSQLQALEDRAIEVAVGFESLKNRLGSPSTNPSYGRPTMGLWSRQGSFQSTTAALAAATATVGSPLPVAAPANVGDGSHAHKLAKSREVSVLRTVTWAGPRRRRPAKDGTPSRVRRLPSARALHATAPGPFSRSLSAPTITPRMASIKRERPLSHWGSFGATNLEDLSVEYTAVLSGDVKDCSVVSAASSWMRHASGVVEVMPKVSIARRKSL
ncbi:hypothetical protein BGZ54_008097 [Gamsiella multidivaricata]|nr:hypothetical protein BGZ54_008097 [Gamsiella multidivaricata]